MTGGKSLTIIFTTLGLIVAGLIMMSFFPGSQKPYSGLVGFIQEFPLNLTIGIIALYISSYFIGGEMQKRISNQKKNPFVTGIIGSILILLIGIIAGSTVAYIKEGIGNEMTTIPEAIKNYYFKPIFWVVFFGFIPVCILGSILGRLIQKASLQNN